MKILNIEDIYIQMMNNSTWSKFHIEIKPHGNRSPLKIATYALTYSRCTEELPFIILEDVKWRIIQ